MEGGKFFDAEHHEGNGQQRCRRQGLQGACWRKTSSCRPAWNNGTSSIISLQLPAGHNRDDDLLAALWALGCGLWYRPGGAELGAEVADRRQSRLRAHTARSCRTCRGLCPVGLVHQQEQGSRLSVHPVAQQQDRSASSVFNCPTRCAIRSGPRIMRARTIARCGQMRRPISTRSSRPARTGLLDLSLLQQDKYDEAMTQGDLKPLGRRRSEGDP